MSHARLNVSREVLWRRNEGPRPMAVSGSKVSKHRQSGDRGRDIPGRFHAGRLLSGRACSRKRAPASPVGSVRRWSKRPRNARASKPTQTRSPASTGSVASRWRTAPWWDLVGSTSTSRARRVTMVPLPSERPRWSANPALRCSPRQSEFLPVTNSAPKDPSRPRNTTYPPAWRPPVRGAELGDACPSSARHRLPCRCDRLFARCPGDLPRRRNAVLPAEGAQRFEPCGGVQSRARSSSRRGRRSTCRWARAHPFRVQSMLLARFYETNSWWAEPRVRPDLISDRDNGAFAAFAHPTLASQAGPTRSQPVPVMGLIAAAEGIGPI